MRIEVVINLDAELIGIIGQNLGRGKQIGARVWKRKEAQQIFRNRVELSLRHLVIRVRCIGEDVEKLVRRVVAEAVREALRAEFGEVSGTLLQRRHWGKSCLALAIAEAFIETENEGFIFLIGTPIVAPNCFCYSGSFHGP